MRVSFAVIISLCITHALPAAVIGTNTSALPVTRERIATLPETKQIAWRNYLDWSESQLRADQAALQSELREHGMARSVAAPGGRFGRDSRPGTSAEWYGEPEARRIADIVVSFQTPAGGWSKNINLSSHKRAPGEHFAPDNETRFASAEDNDRPPDRSWSYVGTFDNNATTSQLRFLAKVISAVPRRESGPYRGSFLRGLEYIFAAQYPNGGWPQVWPLQGGYHDAISYNDNAMVNVMSLLGDVASGDNEFAFVPARVRERAAKSVERAVDCVLATQIAVDGRLTAWCQQHDALTLKPTAARNYEMPSLCSAESAGLISFLMQRTNPGPRVINSVHATATWLEQTKILDVAYRRTDDGPKLVPAEGNGPLWARYCQIGTNRPIFGDRDKTIHDDVNEVSRERRIGYAWYTDSPQEALEEYERWKGRHPAKQTDEVER